MLFKKVKSIFQLHLKDLCLLGLFVFLAGCNRDKDANQIPLENFFIDQVKTSFSISPDGAYISYLQPYNNRLNIFIESVDGRKVSRITQETQDITSYFWANNNKLLYLKDRMEDHTIRLNIVDKDGSNSRQLLSEKNIRLRFLSQPRVLNSELLIALNKRDSSFFDVYHLNINSRKLTLAEFNPGNIRNWFTDQQGKIRMAVASDGVNETLLFRDNEDEPFKASVTNNFKTSISPVGFCENEKSCIYVLSNQDRDKKALVELNYKTGKERKIFGREDVDVTEAGYSVRKKKVTYVVYETWKRQTEYLDPDIKLICGDIEKRLPNTEIRITDQDTASKKFIIRTSTDKTPGAYYLYDSVNRTLRLLYEINPLLKESEMCEMKPVSYTSRDGLTINGYLTLPKGGKMHNLPIVVIPHGGPSGGPSSRNSWGFNSEVQFLANRGYAVFQVNFRGSTGYGKQFWIAGFKKWGTDLQNDITDGVKWLIHEGIANPKRIAIYGSSFGGFSALHGLCFQPDLYACGASYSGLTNLFAYMKSTPPTSKPYLQMYYEMVGNPGNDMDYYYFRAVSPAFHTDKIQDPVLIAQGGKDPRVSATETNQFVQELKKRNIPFTYIRKDDEGHFFRKQENRREFYRKLEAFFADNIGRK